MNFLSSKTLLCVSHVAPWPATHGNEIRLQRLLLWLKGQGMRIILVLTQYIGIDQQELIKKYVDRLEIATPGHPLLQYRSRRQRLRSFFSFKWQARRHLQRRTESAMQAFADSICPPHINTLVRYIAERESIDFGLAFYAFTIQAFNGLPSATMLICDTIECFSMLRSGPDGEMVSNVLHFLPEDERAMLLGSDVVIGIQAQESSYFKTLLPEKSVLTVGIDPDLPSDPGLPSQAPESIGIIGSDNQANIEGTNLFLNHCWPLISTRRAQVRLQIAGKLGLAMQAIHPEGLPAGVSILGWMNDLSEFYRQQRIVVNPVIRGTGLKIKTVEALAHHRPIVCYPIALEGIEWSEDKPWCVAGNPEGMAAICCDLLADPSRCDRLAESARCFADQTLSRDSVYAPLAELFR